MMSSNFFIETHSPFYVVIVQSFIQVDRCAIGKHSIQVHMNEWSGKFPVETKTLLGKSSKKKKWEKAVSRAR